MNTPIQTVDELPQNSDVEAPFEVPTQKEVKPEEVYPSSQEVPRSFELPINQPIEETQGDVGVQALLQGQDVFEVKEPQILEEPYGPSTKELQDQDVKPTTIDKEEETKAPIQALKELPKDGDVEAPFEVPKETNIQPKEVEPSFEEVLRSFKLPIAHLVEETQGDVGIKALQEGQHVSEVEEPPIDTLIMEPQILCKFEAQEKEVPTLEEPYAPSIKQPQDEDVQPTSIEEDEKTPIVKEDTSDPIQTLDELPQDDDVEAPFELPTKKKVESEEVEPSFEEVPRSLELPIKHPIQETQGDVAVEALLEGQDVSKVKEPQIEAPIPEHEIPHKFEAQDKEVPTLEEPYIPSIEQPQDEVVLEDPQSLDQLPQDHDVNTPFEVRPEHKVGPKDVEPTFEEVPTSLDLPITQPIEETQGDVGVEALQEGQHVIEEEESKIDAPITKPQILPQIKAQDIKVPTLEEPYVTSIQQPQDEDVQPTSLEEEVHTPIINEKTTDPIQGLDELAQNDDVNAPIEVPTEHRVKPKDVEPTFEEVPTSLNLLITHPIEETQVDVGVEALQEGQHVVEEEESKMDAPITEPQILPQIEAQDKEVPTLKEPHVPSTQQPQDEDVKPTFIEEEEHGPIIRGKTTHPIQGRDELAKDDDVNTPIGVPIEHRVKPEDVEQTFEEVPRSLDLAVTHPVEEARGDVGVETLQKGQHVIEENESKIDAPIMKPQILPQIEARHKEAPTLEEMYVPSIEQPQDEDVQPTSTEEEEKTTIVKEDMTHPIQALDELAQDDDVNAPIEIPTEHRVEPEDVEPSIEEVPRSLGLAITHPIEETEGNVRMETLQKGQHVAENKESKIEAPIREPQILPQIEAQDKEAPTLEEPYVPSTQQPQVEDVKPTSIEEEVHTPIMKEETTDPIQGLDELAQNDDVNAPIEVPTKHKVKTEDVQPSFEEVPQSLDLLVTHPIETAPWDAGVEALQEGQHIEEEESKIDVPITEPQILPHIEAQDKEAPTLEEPYVPSTQQQQDEDVHPKFIEDEETTDAIQGVDELQKNDDVHTLFEVPTEHRVQPKDVEANFEQVPKSLDVPITHPVKEIQGVVGVETLQEGQHVVEEEESKSEASITEPQILSHTEAQDKEAPTLEQPYVPSTQQPEDDHVEPQSMEEDEETPIVK
jgi:hypothetical protein